MPDDGIPERIRRARLTAGFATQTDLAERIGHSHDAVQKWESGSRVPQLPQLEKVAEATERSVEWLIYGDPLLARIERLERDVAEEREARRRLERTVELLDASGEATRRSEAAERERAPEGG